MLESSLLARDHVIARHLYSSSAPVAYSIKQAIHGMLYMIIPTSFQQVLSPALYIALSNLAGARRTRYELTGARCYELAGAYRDATASLVLFYEEPRQTQVKAAYVAPYLRQ
jgi:hypothetical protein